jgi:bifunctional DNA primase/polymerase-like protein
VKPDTVATLRAAALVAAGRGWCVFPQWPGTKVPALHHRNRCPGTGDCREGHKGWEQRATADPERIERCWTNGRRPFNVGIATGPSGLVVIDLDAAKPGQKPPPPWDQPGITSGEDVFVMLCAQAGLLPPLDTYTVTTPSQPQAGTHLYYQAPPDVPVRSTVSDRGHGLGWKVDTRAMGGAVVAAGSVVRGRQYLITADLPLMPLPAWLAARLAKVPTPRPSPAALDGLLATVGRRSRYASAALRGEVDRVLAAGAPGEGCRNDTLNVAAYAVGQLVGAGLIPERLAQDALLRAGVEVGLSERECLSTIHSGLSAGQRTTRGVKA